MGKKSSNPINSQMKKKAKASKNLTSTLFETQQIKLKINPIVIISLFILLISIVIAWGKYRQQALCQILTSDYEDKILWISVPDHKNTKDYVSLDNGAFVYRHIYMDEFEKEFNVKPLHFPTIDPDIANFLARHNLRARILNNTELNQEFVSLIFSKSEKWAPIIEDTKFRVGNGTYIDDERVYVRWVNDIVKWEIICDSLIIVMTIDPDIANFLARHNLRARILNNTELNQEFVSLIFSKSEKWAPIIEDTKFRVGNGTYIDDERVYVRWVNDIVKWEIICDSLIIVMPHKQIFVNYGQTYWDNKQKYNFD
ncbi:hypothetical protein C2G38_2143897 [Gigaspora rosea]|uniref:Uncharacterized protein n=1 Tax=Gigaspora rosea TaxID=44941 RepID=A0A397V480_9GLOM|nr:hypothetical protein C2G38_2143897 [Gigaspora rosea]